MLFCFMTTSYKSTFLRTLHERGFLYQGTDMESLDELCEESSITAYIGFDATANSLHVGNLLGLMMMRWLQETGHHPILLMGGGTTKIGDPSGRNTQRSMLSDDVIQKNIACLQADARKIVKFSGDHAAHIVNNAEWLDSLQYIPFLRDIGVHFSINHMLSFEMVRTRLEQEQPLSFIEFNYMLLQSYDFLELYKKHGCVLQMGGSDQWGNIVCGVDLIRRMTGKKSYGVTCPLLTTATGAKMGKSADGAIWLNPERLSPYHYWQFWRNTHDQDVERFLKLYTMLPLEKITALAALQGKEINEAKKVLADEAATLLHGATCLPGIHDTAQKIFENDITTVSFSSTSNLPSITVSQSELSLLTILDVLEKLSLVPSRREGRQKIREGAVRIHNTVINQETYNVTMNDAQENKVLVSVGQKKHGLIHIH